MSGIAGACGLRLISSHPEMLAGSLYSLDQRGVFNRTPAILYPDKGDLVHDNSLRPGAAAFLVERTSDPSRELSLQANRDNRLAIALDGSILNMIELRNELAEQVNNVDALADEEVLGAGFSRHGLDYAKQLVGQFAIALLDRVERKLHLIRDEFGIKTLYFHTSEDGLCFSSDLPSLLEWPHIPRRVDPHNLLRFLRHGSTDQEGGTFFEGIRQVLPGHRLSVDIRLPQHLDMAPYSQSSLPDVIDISFNEAADRVRELFLRSVSLNMQSRSLVGASLSGGTDSTAIVSAMRLVGGAETQLHTFSYVAPGHVAVNEEPWIDLVNSRVKAISHKVTATSTQLVEEFEKVTKSVGEPLGSTSQYVQKRVYEEIRRSEVPVVLDGIAGDGVTAGHKYYLVDRLYELLRGGHVSKATVMIILLLRNSETRMSRMIIAHALTYLPDSVATYIRVLLKQQQFPAWLDQSWFDARGVSTDVPQSSRGSRALHRHIDTVIHSDRLSRYAERASATSLSESRLPFLYRPLTDFLLSLPSDYLVSSRAQERHVFRAAMRGVMPDEVLDRKDKVGFQPPQSQWLSEQDAWVFSTLGLAKETGVPIRTSALTGSQMSESSLVRCIAVVKWGQVFEVDFNRS